MKEVIEFRISNEFVHLLLKPNEGKRTASNTIIYISRDDPRFEQIRLLSKHIREKYNEFFFLYSNIRREYSNKELDAATLLQVKIAKTFEPSGEECGTIYDESFACDICGSNRKQIGKLRLNRNTIPPKDISKTIAGEVVVSKRFASVFNKKGLKGVLFLPINLNEHNTEYYQSLPIAELELTRDVLAGVDIFDFSEGSEIKQLSVSGNCCYKIEKEVYKCPKGHTIGLNLLSELHVYQNPSIINYDFFSSKQRIGVRRGVLQPEPMYLCSQAFRRMVLEEKLSGFEFEVAHVK